MINTKHEFRAAAIGACCGLATGLLIGWQIPQLAIALLIIGFLLLGLLAIVGGAVWLACWFDALPEHSRCNKTERL
jgi:hypothetical protein